MTTTSSGNSNLPINPAVALAAAAPPDLSAVRVLPPVDSPAMKFAIGLCGEIFPGSPVDVEVMSDPEDPDRSWYCLNVDWAGDPRDCVDRSLRGSKVFDAEYREYIHDFLILVTPV